MCKYLKKISLFAIIFITLFTSFYTSFFARAEEYTTIEKEVSYDYNTSSVIEDLNNGVEVPENEFFPTKYLANIFKDDLERVIQGNYTFEQDLYVISFIENGYGTNKLGLYFYVYNPKSLTILSSSNKNKVQFSFSDNERDVFYSQFAKYNIDFVDKTENNLYWKFKVNGFTPQNYYSRYYAVSGIEIHIDGNNNATEYTVGSVYYCVTNGGKTTISRKPLSAIDVDVTHVFYRTDDSVKGKGWSNQLSACYFSLPKEYSFENNPFGTLSEILAEFVLYYTKPILLLNNQTVYNHFYSALGIPVDDIRFDDFSDKLAFGVFNRGYRMGGGQGPLIGLYDIGYNLLDEDPDSAGNFDHCFYSRKLDSLYWVFCDILADFDNEDYYYPAENLANYAYQVYESNGYYSFLDLFENQTYFYDNDISLCGFNYGYNEHTYSISQNPANGAVLGYELTFDNHGFWQSIAEFFGFNQTQTVTGIAPLVRVEYADRNLTDDAFSEKYLVAKHQVSGLKNELNAAGTEQEVWLFRYDCSEYYGAKAEVYDKNIQQNAFDGLVCQEPVYLYWDILSFTFEQEGIDTETQQTKTIKTIVPVIHSPEDVFSDLTRSVNDFPPDSGCTDYGSVLSIISLLSGAFMVWWLISWIVKKIQGR